MAKRKLKGYLCGTDATDIALGAMDVVIYPTIKSLKNSRTCWEECGIAEIEIKPKFKVKPLKDRTRGGGEL